MTQDTRYIVYKREDGIYLALEDSQDDLVNAYAVNSEYAVTSMRLDRAAVRLHCAEVSEQTARRIIGVINFMRLTAYEYAPPTKVIFRYWRKEKIVIALLPEVAASTSNPYLCEGYTLSDGFGATDALMIMNTSRPATEAEYARTKTVMERDYGYRLKVYKRITPQMRQALAEDWKK